MTSNIVTSEELQQKSLIAKMAQRYNVEPSKFKNALLRTAFRDAVDKMTNEELMSICIVANQYNLNPFTREIYAFPGKNGGIVPIVSVDGWARIITSNPRFDGVSFVESEQTVQCLGMELPAYIECTIFVKGNAHPVSVREYMAECAKDNSSVWRKWPRRMLRHKAYVQCARMAFGLSGIYDDDGATVGQPVPPVGAFEEANVVSETAPSQGVVNGQAAESSGFDQAKADACLRRLMAKRDADHFWTRAEKFVASQKFTEAERQYVLGKLAEIRSAEEGQPDEAPVAESGPETKSAE